MTLEVGVLVAGAAAFGIVAVPAAIGGALGTGAPEPRAVWLRWSDRVVIAAGGVVLLSFLVFAVVDLASGNQTSAFFGTTSGPFRFVLDLLLLVGLVPIVAVVAAYLIGMIRLWALAAAADQPSARVAQVIGVATWVVFGLLIALPLIAIAGDLSFVVTSFSSFARQLDASVARSVSVDLLFLGLAVVPAVWVRRGHPTAAASVLAAAFMAWPVVVVARAAGAVDDGVIVRVGLWYAVAGLAIAVCSIGRRIPTPPAVSTAAAVGGSGRSGYALGALIVVVGVGSGLALAVRIDAARPTAPTQAAVIPVPGTASVPLAARPYALYAPRGAGTRDLHTGITVTGPAGVVPVVEEQGAPPAWGVGEQGWAGYDGVVFGRFEPSAAGRYEFTTQIPSSWELPPEETFVVTVGDPPPPADPWAMRAAELLTAASALVGVAVIAATGWRRARARARARAAVSAPRVRPG